MLGAVILGVDGVLPAHAVVHPLPSPAVVPAHAAVSLPLGVSHLPPVADEYLHCGSRLQKSFIQLLSLGLIYLVCVVPRRGYNSSGWGSRDATGASKTGRCPSHDYQGIGDMPWLGSLHKRK